MGTARSADGAVADGRRAATIIDLLRRRAETRPRDTLFTFRPDSGGAAASVTFGALEARARAIGARLLEEGLGGERALLLYPAGLEFVEAFFGCLYAGVVAVPAHPPRANRTLDRLGAIAADAAPRAALAPAGLLAKYRQAASSHPALSRLRWQATDGAPCGKAPSSPAPPRRAGSIAYLQYTSGSTSAPKGVVVTHANLLANSEEIRRGFRHTRESRSLCWLPHFHDMGLVDGVVQPVYSGFPAVLMSPASFLQEPACWLEAIARHAITHSGGPNFAYDLCARRVEPDPERLDLESWAVAYNGAEPVRAETLERFASRFARCGFRREAFYPAYGLAEATLKVSGGVRGEGPRIVRVSRAALEAGRARDDVEGIALVGSGRGGPGTRIAIVEGETGRELAEDEVGEIWVAGPAVARGYWNRSEETEAAFGSRLARRRGRFLRTGDLGFLRGGELFVTGRVKDLVIVRGRNVYPHDVERTAESSHAALRPGGGAAFGVEAAGEERLVLVHEVERLDAGETGEILAAVRAAIVETHEVDPWTLVLVERGGVPKTSSGKVRRSACRQSFLEGSLAVVASWRAEGAAGRGAGGRAGHDGEADAAGSGAETASQGALRAWIASRVASKLGVEAGAIDPDAPLARYGLDSLRSLELAHEIEARTGAAVPAVELLATSSLSEILARIEASAAATAAARTAATARHADPGSAEAEGDPEECPLSAGQQALWFLQQLDAGSTAYTIASALRLVGPLDEEALERAARSLVARHASLRARIVSALPGGAAGEGGVRQRFDVPFEAIYARGQLRGEAPEELPERLATEAGRPFDLARGPLFRVSLLREGEARILLLAAHHMVADLWSLSVALRDLQAFYAAEVEGGMPPEGRAPHPAAFVSWQGRLLAGEEGARQLAFWREQLAGAPPALELPADRPRPPAQTFRGGVRMLRLDPALAGALRELARSRGVTLYTLLVAAYQAFLLRVTGQRELLVGSPASGRTAAGFDRLVAYLVNAVVLRADLAGDPAFDDLVRATRERVGAALGRQDYPFAALVKRLAPRRDPSRSPFFDTMFDLHAAGGSARGRHAARLPGARAAFAAGVEAEPLAVARRAAQFDLSVTVTDGGEDLGIELEYNADLFDPATVDGLARGFATLLDGAAAQPSARLSRLPLLGPVERAAARRDANARPEPVPPGCVHHLLEREAARRPEAVAAWHAGASLAYGELDRRAARLARTLRASGVGPESRVAVCVEKSLDLLVALVGVLKAGGAFVPVEPSLPSARRRFLVADSGARVVIARDALPDDFGPGVSRPREAEWTGAAGGKAGGARLEGGADRAGRAEREDGPAPGNLAYVIYTSGTTGTPKGVGVTHANLLGAYRAWESAYDLRSLAVHLQMAGPGFDVFTGDLVRAFGSGGSLVLCDKETLLDPPALAALARAHRVEFAEFVPATLRELAAHLARSGERLDSLRLVAVGSDTWTMADYALFREAFGRRARIVNSYGVTEATIDSTLEVALDAGSEGEPRRAAPAIGRPLSNTSAWVLDESLEPVPAGVRGELYLGGPAVARGYVGRPELTAERFVPDPHGGPGARLYRTGDTARRLHDGRIEFIGRADAQVKVRGHRIEPAEIEAVLEAHPGVRSCAVAVRDQGGARRLVAYVVPAVPAVPTGRGAPDRGAMDAAALRAHVAERLPDSMVPSAFVSLDALPLTENGKVDRRALPEPDWGAASRGVAPSGAPADATERALAGVFERVLGLPRVGSEDDFFELGGDSILTIQVVARAREAGLALTPRMVFEQPTVAGLARAAGWQGLAAPPSGAWEGEAPMLPIQRWFFDRRFEEPSHWNMAIALDAREPLDAAAGQSAARALIDHHDALRARFERGGAGWRQVIGPPGAGEAGVSVVVPGPNEDREAAVARCAGRLARSLDLERGTLVRFGIVACRRGAPGAAATLVLVAHHLVVDGVSLRLLVEDFERAYRGAVGGGPIELPARTAAAGAWGAALEGALRAGGLDEELESWRRLAAAEAVPLPLDRPESVAVEGTTEAVTIELDERETADLLRSAPAGGAGVEEALLAALAAACARWTGRPALLVEEEGHGRDLLPDLDLSRTVGWFTQTRPVLLEGIDPSDLGATLEAVRRARRAAPGWSFLALRHLHPDPRAREALGGVPVPQVSFNYLGRFDATTAGGSLFERLREPASARRSARARRTHALEIDASVSGGRLGVRWSFSRAQLDPATVARVAAGFREALGVLAAAHPARGEDVEEALPLTPMQEGMLFHHLRGGGADPYVSQIALELTGEVDAALLARAWRLAFARHPALRADFAWEGVERPVQVVRREAAPPVAVHQGDGGRAGKEAALEAIMAAARARGFDLSRAPLARVDLVPTGARTTTAVFTHHHILLDGWSLPLLLGSVFEAYEALLAGRDLPPRADPGLRPYVAWLASRDQGAAERFFRRYLDGFSSPTPLPDPAGRPGGSPEGARGSGVVRVPAGAGSVRRARALGLTPSTVVQAAWALVLAACSGERDVVFGATTSGRPPEVEGIESLVGLCINTLPVRADVDPRARARGWMRELQGRGAELRQHEHAPLALVQRCAAAPADRPLFESLLVFENYPIDVAALGRRESFEVTAVRLHEETNYPLTIVATYEDGLRFRGIHDRARYDEAAARLVLERLAAAVEGLLERPDAPLGEISVFVPGEAERVVVAFNDTRRPYPREATIVEVFEEVARARPDQAALLHDGGSTSYAELRGGARALGWALAARGVGPESRVALAIDRSPALVTAILGVLRAGGAYLPLDPESPPARTGRMLAAAGVSLVVTDGGATVPEGEWKVVPLDQLQGPSEDAPSEDAGAPPARAEGLAYVMFTSGSTGEPKGIEVTHRNVLRLVIGSEYAVLGPGQTSLLLAPAAFDASTFEIWGALLRGGRLAIAPPGAASAAEIARMLERFGVTAVWLTSGLFHVMVDEEPAALARVPQVLAGGDVIAPSQVRRLLAAGCGRVVNAYGPTETTTFACCDVLAPGDEVGERVPIGPPIANTTVYLLGASMRPVPIGAPGELHVGGDGVARGYAARPDLTAERFVPDPFGPAGARLYRTGDLARWRPDGRLEFLGRQDGQVKVRGFRFEVGEVESALGALPGVRAAAVLARRDGAEVELVGYVVADGAEAREAGALRDALGERLPRSMVPSRIVFLDALPLTPNGKVDRPALPDPGRAARLPRAARPLTPVEEAVVDLWRRVLGVEQIGPEDDFFEMGGHSLHAIRLLAALRRAFRVELPMAALFEATTVAATARALAAHQPEEGHVERAARALAKLRAMTYDERLHAADEAGTRVKTGRKPEVKTGTRRGAKTGVKTA